MKTRLIMIVLVNLMVLPELSAHGFPATDKNPFPDSPELRIQVKPENDAAFAHYLVKEGVPAAQIIIAPNAPPIVMLAAKELRDAIWKMSGVNLPVRLRIDEDIPFKVFVGRSRHTDTLGIDSEGCRDGGYKMVSGEDYLVLLGDDEEYEILGPHSKRWSLERNSPFLFKQWYELTGATWDNEYISQLSRKYDPEWDLWEADGRGSFNAVNEFLYEQGIRYYYPGPIGEIIPEKQSIGFHPVCKTINPDFKMRHNYIYFMDFFTSVDEEILWQLRLGTNGIERYSGFPAGHGIRPVINNDSMKKNHPEYYSVWTFLGGRQNGDNPAPNLCSEGLYQENLNYIKAIIDIYDEKMISVMPTDGFSWFSEESDSACLAWDRGASGMWQNRLSDYVWEYVNNLAWDIYHEYGPERKISCDVYPAYREVPTKLTKPPAPNLVIYFQYSRADLINKEYKEYERDLFRRWREFHPTTDFYTSSHYLKNVPGNPTEKVPTIFPHIIAEDLKYMKGKSLGESLEVASSFFENPWSGGYDVYAGNNLNSYVTARMYWDADQEVDALLEEYYTLFYGPASKEMKAFHEYVEANYHQALENPHILSTMRNFLGEAKKAAGDTIYGERVDLLIGLMDHEKMTGW